jgi:hypothetical protein
MKKTLTILLIICSLSGCGQCKFTKSFAKSDSAFKARFFPEFKEGDVVAVGDSGKLELASAETVYGPSDTMGIVTSYGYVGGINTLELFRNAPPPLYVSDMISYAQECHNDSTLMRSRSNWIKCSNVREDLEIGFNILKSKHDSAYIEEMNGPWDTGNGIRYSSVRTEKYRLMVVDNEYLYKPLSFEGFVQWLKKKYGIK